MSSALQFSVCGGQSSMAVAGSSKCVLNRARGNVKADLKVGFLQCEFLGQMNSSTCQLPKKMNASVSRIQESFTVISKIRKTKRAPMDPDYPWPAKYKADDQGFLAWLSKFKNQAPKKPKKPMNLPFERELVELEKKIDEVKKLATNTGMDFTGQINELQAKYGQLKKDIYNQLTPVQRLSVARHPNRPTFLDHVHVITDKWVELHGDRGGYDDPALVCGIGMIDGMSFMMIGHQKGRNTKENIYRNFGMPTPNGYRKALRLMKHADHFGLPIICFVDTPGAYAGVTAEYLGQGEAIAMNLREMFGLSVPSIAVVIGEGGSGGALAIGCCNKMLMLENSVYYVASPEACAAILWKTASAAPKATAMLKITGHELHKQNIVDEVIPEPLGGAHANPTQTSLNIKASVMKFMKELIPLSKEEIMAQRVAKFRQMGGFLEGVPVNPRIQRKAKKADASDNGVAQSKSKDKMLPSSLPTFETKITSPPEVNATPVNAVIGRGYDP